jgi:hypothetical protein
MSNPITRRHLFGKGAAGIGSVALAHLLGEDGDDKPRPHHAPKARRLVYLFQSGGPSQLETFDHKPLLQELNGQELPDSVRQGQRLTGMSGNQATLPLAGAQFRFDKHGESRQWVSELLPHTARIVDELTIVKSMHTEAINHDPAITFFQTGSQIAGRPSIGSWLSYGLGTANRELPAFCVLVTKNKGGQPLYARLWGNGFLPATHQGVQFRPGRDRVLYLADPDGVDTNTRRRMLDRLRELHEASYERDVDPAVRARIEQYEMAYRMQMSVPEVTDLSDEPDWVFEHYGEEARDPGTYAANCLMARRLLERGVRCVQLYHQGWDQHGGLPGAIRRQCRETDRASAALVMDLKARGLLDDTLVVWGGEFGRTNYSQGKLTDNDYGRDHHPRCFSMWLAGAGLRGGYAHGQTCDYGYNVVQDPVHVHDLQATILHLLGLDHERLTFFYQGRDFRLTDVHGKVVHQLLG